jgi:hypothetical protein
MNRMARAPHAKITFMEFQAYCPYCEKTVTAYTLLDEVDLKRALDSDRDVETMHTTYGLGDHQWKLIKQEKDNLRSTIAKRS